MLAAYCNKIDFFLWIDPKRHMVRQRMTVEKCQLDKDGSAAVSVKLILQQPSSGLDASARRPYLEYLPIFMLSSPLSMAQAATGLGSKPCQPCLLRVCPLALYGCAALVKVVPTPPAAS
jgi:hypothetical protein